MLCPDQPRPDEQRDACEAEREPDQRACRPSASAFGPIVANNPIHSGIVATSNATSPEGRWATATVTGGVPDARQQDAHEGARSPTPGHAATHRRRRRAQTSSTRPAESNRRPHMRKGGMPWIA